MNGAHGVQIRLGLSVLLLLSLVLVALSASASAQSGKATTEEPSLEAPAPPSAEELPGKRTATSDTYELHSGLLETRIYDTPVNYEDPEGEWQPIEEGLEEGDGGEIVNGANSVEIRLPSELQEGLARVTIGDQWIGSRLLGTETESAELSEGAAVYESPEANTSFEYTTIPDGLKEEIELEGPSSPSSFRYMLTASPGLDADLSVDGSVIFKDAHGGVVATLPAPTVADAQSLAPNPDEVSYQLAPREGGAWVLTVSVDPEWLEAPNRAWPVRIDPTITKEEADLDCTIGGVRAQEGWIDCSSWGRQVDLAGYNAEYNQAEDSWYRTLMYLSTAEIPKGADVSSADLMLYAPEAAQNTSGVQVAEVTKPWTWRANWKYYDTAGLWSTEGGDSEFLGEQKTSSRGSGAGWWSLPVPAAKAQQRAEHDEDLSLMVKLRDDKSRQCDPSEGLCTHRLISFYSSAATPVEDRPYLRVVYDYHQAPSTSRMLSPEEGRITSHDFKLRAGWTSEGLATTGVTYQMKLPEWDEFRTIPGQYVLNGKGEPVSWPLAVDDGAVEPVVLDYPAAALTMEPQHEFPVEKGIKLRAVFAAGSTTARGASEPVTVEYAGPNGGNGAPTDAVTSVGPANVDLLTGNFTISRTDVSIPVPGSEASLEFGRTYESNYHDETRKSWALGGFWQPSAALEQEAEGLAWTKLLVRHEDAVPPVYEEECWDEDEETFCEEWVAEEEIPAADWVELFDSEGPAGAFEIVNGAYVAPEYMKEWVLAKEGENFILTGPERTRTIFTSSPAAGEFQPSTVSWQATAKSARLVYQLEPITNHLRLQKEIGPAPPGVSECGDNTSTTTPGCRTLVFNYFNCACWHEFRLGSISYYGPTGSGTAQTVAQYGYDSEYRLKEQWDPRVSSPLKETYTYESGGDPAPWKLASLTPPGEAPWQFHYYGQSEFQMEGGHWNWRDKQMFWRLKSVSRASLVEATPTATTTIAYMVPTGGSGSPYDLSPNTIADWGQSDFPVDATAVFPPDQVPSSPHPSDFSHATVHYLDPEGHEVNSATPAAPGAEGPSISTSEVDTHGNIVREVTPQNRLRALAAGSESVTRSRQLDSSYYFSNDGTEMLESWGPLHQVRLEGGETVEARLHTIINYDEGAPPPPPNTPWPHLPTKEASSAYVPGGADSADERTIVTHYNWNLRKPTETIADPGEGHLAIKSVTVYDEKTGLPLETRQPSNSTGGGAGTTKYVYYTGNSNANIYPECESNHVYAGLPCKTLPAAQASGTGRPELLVKRFPAYNNLGEPTEILESPGGGEANTRKTVLTYDPAGRQLTKKITGGGQAIPKVETEYSPTLGMPVAERFKCESECEAPQFLTSIGYSSQSHTGLKSPSDVALDAAGNIWALDKGNNRIVEYSEGGEFLREAGGLGTGAGKLSSPSAIDVDSSGNIWLADTANNRVAEFSATGAFLETFGSNVNKTKVEAGGSEAEKNLCTAASGNTCQAGTAGSSPGQMKAPLGIAAPSTGGVWVVDTGNSRLEKFNKASGANTAVVSGEGTEPGKLKSPSAIAFRSDGWFWVADTGNNRIEEWNAGFGFERAVGKEGLGNGEFKAPAGIAVDASGKLFVAEQGNNRVQKLSEAGAYLLKFGAAGSAEGQFSLGTPSGLALDAKGNVLVADPGNNRVQKWSATGFDSQETRTTYDSLGRPTAYEDADGNKAETTYDLDGRPVKATDAKGSQTLRYDPSSGLPIELEDSAAGVFTANYNADGSMVKRGLPDGLTAETTYDSAGEPTHLSYRKASNCGANCLWLDFGLEMSISGQIVSETGTLGTDHYRYDKAGRLTYADETPQEGQCTARTYSYDADSNRLSKTTRSPGIGGVCAESGGSTQSYEYDGADRLKGPTYDSWGRITSLPATYAGGKTLTTGYFSNDMVATQSQNGVSNTFTLDGSIRQRSRLQAGGLEGTEIFHYDSPGDSPAWTERGSTWTRNIVGIGGELAALQESGKEITLQLTNLHGDVSATAALSPEVTSLKERSTYDEFGNPTASGGGRYAWLGGRQRRTELPSGVIQMGARSYIPQLGRFLTPDPVMGGSANPYDYANQDPINAFDLEGTCSTKKDCRRAKKKVEVRSSRAASRILNRLRKIRERRAEQSASASVTHVGPIPIRVPWEKEVENAIHAEQNVISNIFGESCKDSGGALGAAGTALVLTGQGLKGGSPGEASIGEMLEGFGGVLGVFSLGFYSAHKARIC